MLKLLSFLLLATAISCQQDSWPRFLYHTRTNPDYPTQITSVNGVSGFDPARITVFLIHGFGGDRYAQSVVELRNAYLPRTNFNVITVDWKEGAAAPNYFVAAPNTKVLGPRIADFIRQNNIDPKKVYCVGHSLGAHSCGFLSKSIKIARIYGLDPAGPLFKGTTAENRLDRTDADYVQCIHTDAFLGIQDANCQQDFYPNGGVEQPGCVSVGRRSVGQNKLPPTDDEFQIYHLYLSEKSARIDITGCSHNRVPKLMAETILSCGFTSTLCDNYANWQNGNCRCGSTTCVPMGHCNSATNVVQGKFYLDTKPDSPYSLN